MKTLSSLVVVASCLSWLAAAELLADAPMGKLLVGCVLCSSYLESYLPILFLLVVVVVRYKEVAFCCLRTPRTFSLPPSMLLLLC